MTFKVLFIGHNGLFFKENFSHKTVLAKSTKPDAMHNFSNVIVKSVTTCKVSHLEMPINDFCVNGCNIDYVSLNVKFNTDKTIRRWSMAVGVQRDCWGHEVMTSPRQ